MEIFSAQSFLRSVTLTVIAAIARRVFSRLRDPFCCRLIRRCSARYRAALRSLIRGTR